jgi:hypothetical protein
MAAMHSPHAADARPPASSEPYFSWPAQKPPAKVITVRREDLPRVPGDNEMDRIWPAEMILASLNGHAARAINEGRFDELIWYELGMESYSAWKRLARERLGFEDAGVGKLWDVVRRYHEAGIIKGYVLYCHDRTERRLYEVTDSLDESANVATVVAALTGGIIVSEDLEPLVQELGLRRLFDARDKDEAWCLREYGDRLSDRYVLVQEPRVPNVRSIAIAHPMMVVFGVDEVTDRAYARLQAPAPVIGWNSGDEFTKVAQMSRHGHFLVPCNWSANLPLLSAAAERFTPPPLRTVDPTKIDFDDRRPTMSFMLSDGDNLQWMMGAFFHNRDYWADPRAKDGVMDFGVCLDALLQACPDAYRYLVDTQPELTVVQKCGGYFYPDLFASNHGTKRRELLATHARRLGSQVARTGARAMAVIVSDFDSDTAKEAYAILAREIDGLAGLLAIQYAPYHGGEGAILWMPNRDGIDIPVVSCRYSLWANLKRPGAGGPDELAKLINADATAADAPYRAWTVVHAWSAFVKQDDGTIAHSKPGQPGVQQGTTPAAWTAEQLDPQIRVVPIEEMLWRVRMEQRPEQTRRVLAELARPR